MEDLEDSRRSKLFGLEASGSLTWGSNEVLASRFAYQSAVKSEREEEAVYKERALEAKERKVDARRCVLDALAATLDANQPRLDWKRGIPRVYQ